MAEKEERILVLNATEDDFIYKHFNEKGFIPRAEVVERMAKAICSSDGESCKQCAVKNDKHACKSVLHDELFMEYAEAALNALLERG